MVVTWFECVGAASYFLADIFFARVVDQLLSEIVPAEEFMFEFGGVAFKMFPKVVDHAVDIDRFDGEGDGLGIAEDVVDAGLCSCGGRAIAAVEASPVSGDLCEEFSAKFSRVTFGEAFDGIVE